MGDLLSVFAVAPLVGARVEIVCRPRRNPPCRVAPLVGAERLYMLIYVLFKNSRYICKENTCYFLIDYDYAGMT